jgi:hypothetical protein
MERKDLKINCKEIVEMVKSGDYKLKFIYWTNAYYNYFQLKDDIDTKSVLRNNSDIKGPFPHSDIDFNYDVSEFRNWSIEKHIEANKNLYDVDDRAFKNMEINETKPLYYGDVYTFEESFIGDGGFMDLDGFMDFIEEDPDNYSLSEYIEDWSDDGWVFRDVGDVCDKESQIKIGASEPKLIQKNDFNYYEFENNISTVISPKANYEIRDWGINFLVHPTKMDKK